VARGANKGLCDGFLAAHLLEEHVVGGAVRLPLTAPSESRGAGIKRRVKVYQVNAGVGYVLAEDFQIVAEVESVFGVHIGESIKQADALL